VANIAADLTVQRLTGSGTTVDGPYNGMSFGVVATDADLVGMRNPSFNWNLAGAAEGLALGSTNLYFGRARVDNAYGSLLSTLPVRVYTEYWTGTGFTRMTTDSCSRITVPATVSMSSTPTATLYCNGGVGLYGSLTGVAATIGGVTAGNAATLSNGSATISLSKPTNSGGGYLDLAVSVPDYLKYNVDGVDQTLPGCGAVADSYLHDDNPRARIRFGARTNDKVLYLREVY
jgi:MSHA biogenesis protein MshQ